MGIQSVAESLERWHLKKEISFGNLLTSIIGITAIVVWIFALQNRVSINETRIEAIVETDDVIRSEVQMMAGNIMLELKTIGNRQYDHLKDHNLEKPDA